MNHSQLRAFHAVASARSFTRAAAIIGLSQPTLSSHVKALETGYGVRLFERGGRELVLSEFGRALFEITGRYFAVEGEALRLLAAAKGLVRGRLVIGADSPFVVLPILAAFSARYPRVAARVEFGNSKDLLAGVLARRIDVGIFPGAAPDPRLSITAIREDQLILIVDRAHPWAGRRSVAIAALAGQTLVRREAGSTTRAILDDKLKNAAITPAAIIEMGSREAVKEAVAAGIGVSVLFESEFGGDARLAKLVLGDAALGVVECAICLCERDREPALAAFLEMAAKGSG